MMRTQVATCKAGVFSAVAAHMQIDVVGWLS